MRTIHIALLRLLSRAGACAWAQLELGEPDYAAAGSPAARGLDL